VLAVGKRIHSNTNTHTHTHRPAIAGRNGSVKLPFTEPSYGDVERNDRKMEYERVSKQEGEGEKEIETVVSTEMISQEEIHS